MERKSSRRGRPLELATGEPASPTESLPKLDGLVRGELVGFGESGEPLVQFHGNPAGAPVAARALVNLGPRDCGREIGLMFEGGDPSRPIALGAFRERADVAALVDGERVEIRAAQEICLRVGKASITLTKAGKVLIRGAYLLSRSSGVNRIKGGSVQIN